MGDRVLYDTGVAVDEGGEGYRLGKVLKVLDQGHLKIKLETLKLDKGTRPAKEIIVDKMDKLSQVECALLCAPLLSSALLLRSALLGSALTYPPRLASPLLLAHLLSPPLLSPPLISSQAPHESDLKAGEWVRVVQKCKHTDGEYAHGLEYKWQYGVVRYVHSKVLVDVNFDGGEEARGLPIYAHEVQRCEV